MNFLRFAAFLFLFSATVSIYAHNPVIERRQCGESQTILDCALEIQDPTAQSTAVYGNLSAPKEIDVYRFTAASSETIPIEALVPARPSNGDFRPAVVIFGQSIDQPTANPQLPFQLPENFQARLVPAPDGGRDVFFEPFSVERLWRGREEQLNVQAGQTYFVAVYAPDFRTGDYSLGVGTKENFTAASIPGVIGNIFQIKFGMASGRAANALEFLGFFLLILGLALGIGASFCGLVSPEANVFRLSVTGNWLGLILAAVGGYFAYLVSGLSGVAIFQILFAVVLLVFLLLLSFRVRRYNGRNDRPFLWQTFVFFSWLAILGFFVWHVLALR
jgi:hypothetical protein